MSNFATRAEVKEFIGIDSGNTTYDDFINSMLTNSSSIIKSYLGRDIVQATYTDHYYDGDGSDTLILRQYPIISVTSLYDDPDRDFGSDSLLDEDPNGDRDFLIVNKNEIDNEGIIRRIQGGIFYKGKQNIKITYVGGYSSANVPADIKQAQIQLVTFFYNNRGNNLNIKSFKLGNYSVTYKDNANLQNRGIVGANIPIEIAGLLSTYRDSRIA